MSDHESEEQRVWAIPPSDPRAARARSWTIGVAVVGVAAIAGAVFFFGFGGGSDPEAELIATTLAARATSTENSTPTTTTPSPTQSSTSTTMTTPPTVSTVAGEPDTSGTTLGAGWEDLNFGPLTGGRSRMAVTWTGSELFLWGGHLGYRQEAPGPSEFLQDGYLYEPEADSWRSVAEAPDNLCELGQPETMWLDRVVLIYGAAGRIADCATAALFDPATDTWRVLRGDFFDVARMSPQSSLVWTGELLVGPTRGVAYDVRTQETIPIPAATVVGGSSSAVRAHWTGEFVAAIGSGGLETWAVGDDAWLSHEPPPVPVIARDSVWTGDGLLVVNYQMATARWNSEQWTRLGDLPLRFFECLPSTLVAAGTAVVRMCSGIAIWDEARMTWIPVPLEDVSGRDLGALVGTGDAIYSVGKSLRRYRIVRTDDGSIVPPETMPVGVMQLDVPEGFELVESFAPVQDLKGFIPEDETIGLVFGSDGSRASITCTVTSTYGDPQQPRGPGFTEIGPISVFRPGRSTLDEAGNPVNMLEGTAYRAADGAIGFAIPDDNGSDVVFILCPTSDDGSAFASGLWSPWEATPSDE